jgi:hypothetical protein
LADQLLFGTPNQASDVSTPPPIVQPLLLVLKLAAAPPVPNIVAPPALSPVTCH